MKQELKNIPVSEIFILNPRARNKASAFNIRRNIETVGLKRPITVAPRSDLHDGYKYDLVCGQGRLEAYIANQQITIPAIVIDVSRKDALIMSLVENIARKTYAPCDLLDAVKMMRDNGESSQEIGQKIGVTDKYINMLLRLIDNGEERLINAVESGKIPVSVATIIAESPDADIQEALQNAYDNKEVNSKKIRTIMTFLESRKKQGRVRHGGTGSHGSARGSKISTNEIIKLYNQALTKKTAAISYARRIEGWIAFIRESFRKLLVDDNFKNLLIVEKLDTISEIMNERIINEKRN
jgi:ParB family chromosome partitioning protein